MCRLVEHGTTTSRRRRVISFAHSVVSPSYASSTARELVVRVHGAFAASRTAKTALFPLSSITMKPLAATSGNHAIRRAVFYAYLVTVLGATLAPLSGGAYAAVSGLDKLVHVTLFAGVAALLCWNLNSLTVRGSAFVFFVTTALAAAIELVQGRLWYRSGDFWDLLAGSLGALIGVGCCFLLARVCLLLRREPT